MSRNKENLPLSGKHYVQTFRLNWLQHPELKDWLVYIIVPPAETKQAKCKYCHTILGNKLSDLKNHATRAKHVNAVGILALNRTIPFKKVSELDKTKNAEGMISLYIAEHSSILSVDHLGILVKTAFKDSEAANSFTLHKTKCAAIIMNVFEPHFKSELLDDIGDSRFSLLIDESTDISVNKYLGVVIIYYSNSKNNTVSTFLDLMPLQSGTAQAIVDAILECLRRYKLKLENIVSIGTDNANVMVGTNAGVIELLRVECPHIILIRCVCHSLQLAVSYATKDAMPKALEFLIAETYNWFARSSFRQIEYKKTYNLINNDEDPLKIIQCSSTRWLSIERAVKRIMDQWLELQTHFSIMAHQERCYTSEQLYCMYKDKKNYAFLQFLHPILSEVQRVVKIFESNTADHSKILNDILMLISFLLTKVIIPTVRIDPLSTDFENHLDPAPYMGYSFEHEIKELKKSIHFTSAEETDLRSRCRKFVIVLIKQLQQRLPENIRVLKKINLVSVTNVLKQFKEPIFELLEEFKFTPDLITKIENQYHTINLVKWTETKDTKKFWAEVNVFTDAGDSNPFKDIVYFAKTCLVMPVSNADIERVFSAMNVIKPKAKNRMKTKLLTSLLTIRCGLKLAGHSCHTYNIPKEVIAKIGTMQAYNGTEIDLDDLFNI